MNNMRKLMEAVRIDEESIEYRDPDGEFQVIYSFPRGYVAVGKNDNKADISGESFDHLEDAIEHAEICLSIRDDSEYDDGQPSDYEEMQDYMGGDDWDHGQYDEAVEEDSGPSQLNIANDEAYDHLYAAAQVLAQDAIEQAGGVYDEEGDGEEGSRFHTGAQNRQQYIDVAARKFLSDDYKADIMSEFSKMFDVEVARAIRNHNETR